MKKSLYPLIEKTEGTVTYEHKVVKKLYDEVFIGDAERNYYVDRRHEINLCVHYNIRKPGTYSFNEEYQYYVTNGRMSLKLHWSIGIPDDEMVVEKYCSLEEAMQSKYYKDFCELKELIDKEIARQRKLDFYEYSSCSMCQCSRKDSSGESYYIIMEMPFKDSGACVQIHLDKRTKQWKVSTSPCSIISLWNYLKDFDEVNENELHLLNYVSENADILDENSPYYSYLLNGKEAYEQSLKPVYY